MRDRKIALPFCEPYEKNAEPRCGVCAIATGRGPRRSAKSAEELRLAGVRKRRRGLRQADRHNCQQCSKKA